MNGKGIINKYLDEVGADGLCGDECGCPKGDDLAPCEGDWGNILRCVPAKLAERPGQDGEDPETHEYDLLFEPMDPEKDSGEDLTTAPGQLS